MVRLKTKIGKMILTERQQKYQQYHLEKFINMNILQIGEEILPSDQGRVIEQAKFTYFTSGKALWKQQKTIKDQKIKEDEALKSLKPEESEELESSEGLFPKKMRKIEIKNEKDDIEKIEEKVNRKDLYIKQANVNVI